MLNNTNQPILDVYFKTPQPNELPGKEKEKKLLNLKEEERKEGRDGGN